MRNGFRTPPKPNKAQALNQLSTEVENTSMAVRLSQMMIKQLMTNNQSMQKDLTQVMGQLNELQYKFIAVQRALNLDSSMLDSIANEQRLKDFEDAAQKADQEEQLEMSDVADTDSTVTITSTTEGQSDSGIFRSRVKLSETGIPDLISGLTGKRVGDKVKVTLNNIEHNVELLDIKKSKTAPESVEVQQ